MKPKTKLEPGCQQESCSSSLDLALRFDPFQDDFGDQDDRTLRDKIVKTRKPSECSQCAQAIPAGQIVRSRTDIIDGGMMSWKWCNTCTALMAACSSRGDDEREAAEEAYEARCRMNAGGMAAGADGPPMPGN